MNTIPTVNVNLTACAEWCRIRTGYVHGADHSLNCPAKPVDIPLPLDAFRSVTVQAVLGECMEALKAAILPMAKSRCGLTAHHQNCPARPIAVSCSVSGKTWEESEVVDVDNPHDPQGRWGAETGDTWRRTVRECNARWALIKALVTGERMIVTEVGLLPSVEQVRLIRERDAVYAAVAEQVRLEEAMLAAQERTVKAIASPRLTTGATAPESRPAAQALTIFVERLIEQVGNLNGGK